MTAYERRSDPDQAEPTPSGTAPDLPDFLPWVMLMQAIMEAKQYEISNAVLPAVHSGKIKKIATRIKKATPKA